MNDHSTTTSVPIRPNGTVKTSGFSTAAETTETVISGGRPQEQSSNIDTNSDSHESTSGTDQSDDRGTPSRSAHHEEDVVQLAECLLVLSRGHSNYCDNNSTTSTNNNNNNNNNAVTTTINKNIDKKKNDASISTSSIPPQEITDIREKDVICGRSNREIRLHPGNRVFRTLVEYYKKEYVKAGTRAAKQAIAARIKLQIEVEGGRFVKKMTMKPDGTMAECSVLSSDDDDGNIVYIVVSPEVAHEKITKDLRRGPDRRRRKVSTTAPIDLVELR